jgi:hypothetical protein
LKIGLLVFEINRFEVDKICLISGVVLGKEMGRKKEEDKKWSDRVD